MLYLCEVDSDKSLVLLTSFRTQNVSSVVVTCPNCGFVGKLPEPPGTRTIRCHKCNTRFKANPTPKAAPPAPAIVNSLDQLHLQGDTETLPADSIQLGRRLFEAPEKRITFLGILQQESDERHEALRNWSADGGYESMGPLGGPSPSVIVRRRFGELLLGANASPLEILAFARVCCEDITKWGEWREESARLLREHLGQLRQMESRAELRQWRRFQCWCIWCSRSQILPKTRRRF